MWPRATLAARRSRPRTLRPSQDRRRGWTQAAVPTWTSLGHLCRHQVAPATSHAVAPPPKAQVCSFLFQPLLSIIFSHPDLLIFLSSGLVLLLHAGVFSPALLTPQEDESVQLRVPTPEVINAHLMSVFGSDSEGEPVESKSPLGRRSKELFKLDDASKNNDAANGNDDRTDDDDDDDLDMSPVKFGAAPASPLKGMVSPVLKPVPASGAGHLRPPVNSEPKPTSTKPKSDMASEAKAPAAKAFMMTVSDDTLPSAASASKD